MGFVLAFSINQYISWNQHFLVFYRYSFGKYELDRGPIFCAAILNIIISIILGYKIGMAGIMLGTAIGNIGFWIGRIYVVYTEYIYENVWKYVFRQIERIIIIFVEMVITFYVCNKYPITWMGISLRLLVSIFIPVIINFVLYINKELKELKEE